MRVGRRGRPAPRRCHFALGNLTPSENGCRVINVDSGTAAARGCAARSAATATNSKAPKTGPTRDHRGPPATAKTTAARRPIAAAQSRRSSHVSQCGSKKEAAHDVDRGGADWELGSRTAAAADWADIGPSRGKAGEGHARTPSELKKAGGACIRYMPDVRDPGRLRRTDRALAPLIRSCSSSNVTESPTTKSLNEARSDISLR